MNDAPLPTREKGLGWGCGASGLTPIPLSACGEPANLCQAVHDPRQAREHERRVKGIGPRLMTAGAVSPGTIRALSSNDIACRAHGPVTETDFTCQTAYCRQHFTCQQVRIEDSGLID